MLKNIRLTIAPRQKSPDDNDDSRSLVSFRSQRARALCLRWWIFVRRCWWKLNEINSWPLHIQPRSRAVLSDARDARLDLTRPIRNDGAVHFDCSISAAIFRLALQLFYYFSFARGRERREEKNYAKQIVFKKKKVRHTRIKRTFGLLRLRCFPRSPRSILLTFQALNGVLRRVFNKPHDKSTSKWF